MEQCYGTKYPVLCVCVCSCVCVFVPVCLCLCLCVCVCVVQGTVVDLCGTRSELSGIVILCYDIVPLLVVLCISDIMAV